MHLLGTNLDDDDFAGMDREEVLRHLLEAALVSGAPVDELEFSVEGCVEADFYAPSQGRDHAGRFAKGESPPPPPEVRTRADRLVRSRQGRARLRHSTFDQAKQEVGSFLSRGGKAKAREVGPVAERLSKLTYKELYRLKEAHGLKHVYAPTKAALRAKLASYVRGHRDGKGPNPAVVSHGPGHSTTVGSAR